MKFPEVWKISNVFLTIFLTSVLSKVQESYAVEWILEDVQEEISVSQFGGVAGSCAGSWYWCI